MQRLLVHVTGQVQRYGSSVELAETVGKHGAESGEVIGQEGRAEERRIVASDWVDGRCRHSRIPFDSRAIQGGAAAAATVAAEGTDSSGRPDQREAD